MEWFSQKTSIGGTQIPNWAFVVGVAIIIIILWGGYNRQLICAFRNGRGRIRERFMSCRLDRGEGYNARK
jgi:hypothetical protein